jgi:predicted nucleotidyltransferase
MSTLFQEFTQIVSALNERGIDYAICGGFAMAIHGHPRSTVDIDVLVLTEDLEKAWQTAESLGYEVEGLPLSFHDGAVEIRRISKIDKETKDVFTLDFLLVTEAMEKVWNDREEIMLEGVTVNTVSQDGLIFMKTISARTQDLADIERLKNEN